MVKGDEMTAASESKLIMLATPMRSFAADNATGVVLSVVVLALIATVFLVWRRQWLVRMTLGSSRNTDVRDRVEMLGSGHSDLRTVVASQARWEHALDAAKIGVFDVDLTTGHSVTSAGWVRLMGLADHTEIHDTQAHFLSRVHPDDLKRLEKADQDCIKGLTDRSVCEYRVRFSDGTWRWMRSDAVVAARDGNGRALRLIGAQMDVNDVHAAKEELRRGEEKLRLVLSNAPVGMALISTDGTVHFANKAMADIAQCQQQEIVSKGLAGIFIGRGPDEIKNAISLVHSGKMSTYRSENLLLRRDGSAIWAIVSLAPIGMDSEHLDEFVLLVQDITDKKEIEKLRASFFATVSHEMRTPVTSINGALTLVAGAFSHELGAESKKLIDISIMNSTRLVKLVNEILDLERISDDGVSFDFSDERLGDFVNAAVQQIEPYANKYKVRVETDVHDANCSIRTDRRRLEQVLSNLLSNACKFSKPDGVVRLTTKAVDPQTVSISVIDEGVGIPESFRAKIFEPFSQGHLDHLHSKQGSGLGLSIARKIVVGMGGDISFQSVPGQGTEFWFTCPTAQPATIEGAT